MERVIRFRGKRKDNREFCYGYYYSDAMGKHFIVFNDTENKFLQDWEVIPETVGQFTGMTLSNGTDVYEGDIISVKSKPYHHSEVNETYIVKFGKVYLWSQQSYAGTYAFYTVKPKGGTEYGLTHLENDGFVTEVIGTIHSPTETSRV